MNRRPEEKGHPRRPSLSIWILKDGENVLKSIGIGSEQPEGLGGKIRVTLTMSADRKRPPVF